MNVRTFLRQCGLTEDHFDLVAGAIPEAYAALRSISDTTPMFRGFVPGYQSLSYLRNIAVQHALQIRAGNSDLFFTKTALNAAGNHTFLQLHVGQVVLTAHYCGARGSRGVRKAVSRGELNQRNRDLFASEKSAPDADLVSKAAYAQILHAGLSDPVLSAIRIPNRDQLTDSLIAFSLPIVKPSATKVEEVRDRIAETIKTKVKVAAHSELKSHGHG